ncbi:MAG: hypothetical protein LUB61_05395, partial [Eggerthellaceae bacterium]|nr:hypothetical protein [Eggerthellaceae bacterium]
VQSNGIHIGKDIEEVCRRTGFDKVHIVAHSKGGLDVRSALKSETVRSRVVSFITLSSPHKGLKFDDALKRSKIFTPYIVIPVFYLINKLSGGKSFEGAQIVSDLSTENARELDEQTRDVFVMPFRSYGFDGPSMHGSDRLSLIRNLITHYDGNNDGLVPLDSTQYRNSTVVKVSGWKHIVHRDVIDANRKDGRLIMPDGKEYSSAGDLIVDTLQEMEKGLHPKSGHAAKIASCKNNR